MITAAARAPAAPAPPTCWGYRCHGWSGWVRCSPRARSSWWPASPCRRSAPPGRAAFVSYFPGACGARLRARGARPLGWINWAAFVTLAAAALVTGPAHHGQPERADGPATPRRRLKNGKQAAWLLASR